MIPADVRAAPLQSPAPTVNWQATGVGYGVDGYPADPQIAVSTSHVVVTTRAYIGYYDKDKVGTQLKTLPTGSFFAGLNLPQSFYFFDTRAIFDSIRKRFIVGALTFNASACQPTCSGDVSSYLAVGVSKTEDPTQGWWVYYLNAVDTSPGTYQLGDQSDYPSLGVDKDAIYMTNKVCNGGKAFANGCTFRYWNVMWANATQMSTGASSLSGNRFLYFPPANAPALVQPVVYSRGFSPGPPVDPPRAYFVSQLSATQIRIWGLTDPLTNYQMTYQDINVGQFTYPVDARQLGSDLRIRMTNMGNQPLKAVYRYGYLWIVFNDASTWGQTESFTSVRLVRLSVTQFPNIDTSNDVHFRDLIFEGRNPDDPQSFYYGYGWPAVEVNNLYEAVVVYSRSGNGIWPEVRYSVLELNEADMRSSRLLKAGESKYTASCDTACWMSGDTGGASADPDGISVWIAHAYATSNIFQIWVGKVFGAAQASLEGSGLLLASGAATIIIYSIASRREGASPRLRSLPLRKRMTA